MGGVPNVQLVRDLVAQVFRALHISAEAGIEETILIRRGFYCGRRFATSGGHAIWFCEENELKFYGDEGQLLHVVQNLSRQPLLRATHLADAA